MTEIVESYTTDRRQCDVCASAETSYDERDHLLAVELTSFVRETGPHGEFEQVEPDWLPRPEVVKERVTLAEATAEAREIFHSWANKVRSKAAHRTLQTS